jgi:hypothetical protein
MHVNIIANTLQNVKGAQMDENRVANALRALAADDKKRTETARLRDVFPDIEAAFEAGVSRADILQTLHDQGFKMTMKSFESALYRLRKVTPKATKREAPVAQRFGEKVAETQAALPQSITPKDVDSPLGSDEFAGLTPAQRREKVADMYIKPDDTNPLVKRMKEKQK